MAIIIAVAQQKGGAGKTMLAANLAAHWAARRRVGLLDIDPQRSLTRWHALRLARPGLASLLFSDVSGWRLAGELARLAAGVDIVIVDTPPQIDTDARRAVRAAQLVLIPLQPSPPDLWATEGTLAIAAAERRPVALVLNRAPASGRLRREAEAALARQGHAMLPALGNRAGFAQAFARGMGIAEAAPGSLAAAEFAHFAQALEGRIG